MDEMADGYHGRSGGLADQSRSPRWHDGWRYGRAAYVRSREILARTGLPLCLDPVPLRVDLERNIARLSAAIGTPVRMALRRTGPTSRSAIASYGPPARRARACSKPLIARWLYDHTPRQHPCRERRLGHHRAGDGRGRPYA